MTVTYLGIDPEAQPEKFSIDQVKAYVRTGCRDGEVSALPP